MAHALARLGPAALLVAACSGAPGPVASPGAAPAVAATPPARAAAPRRTRTYVVLQNGRPSGEASVVVAADGAREGHFAFSDRGRGPDLETRLVLDARDLPIAERATGHDYWGAPVDEEARLEGADLVWRSASERGREPLGNAFFYPLDGPFDIDADLARALAAAPGHRLPLLPFGEAWLDDETSLALEIGGRTRTLRRAAIGGLGFAPGTVWLDEEGAYFGQVWAWQAIVPAGAEAAIPRLLEEDQRLAAARAARLAAELTTRPPPAGLAFVDARLFDPARRAVLEHRTVVIRDDRIVKVGGPRTAVPAGARVIDARGRTLLPGLWDMHVHLGGVDGVLHLAEGVTTVRDLGNDVDSLAERVARYDRGEEIGPRVLRAGLIDGPGELSAPTGAVVATAEEARAAVARLAASGHVQVKIYSSLDPALVPVIAAEAHRLGLRVSGHVPQGLRAEEAIAAGFDEIQHANMLFLNFLSRPGMDVRSTDRLTVVAREAAAMTLDSAPVVRFIKLMARRRIVIDPTLATFEELFTGAPGEMSPVLAPYAGRLPVLAERGARAGGLPATAEERVTFRASQRRMGELVKRAWDAGVRVVAGTDGVAGLTLARELELYAAAGIPRADVLAIATLGAARVMGVERQRGRVAPGLQADLVLVAGDPLADLGALRDPEIVVCRGLVYDGAALRAAVGLGPAPGDRHAGD